jgi:hypothetical protein
MSQTALCGAFCTLFRLHPNPISYEAKLSIRKGENNVDISDLMVVLKIFYIDVVLVTTRQFLYN